MTENPPLGSRRSEPHPGSSVEADPAVRGTAPPGDDEASSPARAVDDEQENLLKRTRASQAWVALILFTIILILLLIFIIENRQTVKISYFGASGHLPLAVAMLLAAVAGVLLAAIAGTLRILQLRRRVRRARR
jgi:uncharacterized integral membrane protein